VTIPIGILHGKASDFGKVVQAAPEQAAPPCEFLLALGSALPCRALYRLAGAQHVANQMHAILAPSFSQQRVSILLVYSLLPGAKLRFAALWSIAPGKVKPAGVTGGPTNLMVVS
jgi:hypothetical protein